MPESRRNATDQSADLWVRSSYCSLGSCVEVRLTRSSVVVRDGKQNGYPGQPTIDIDGETWNRLLSALAET